MISHRGLNCASLMASVIDHLFMCLRAICVSSLVTLPVF